MRIRDLAVPAAGAVLFTALSVGTAAAGTSVTQHYSFPAAGATITCGATVLTPVQGVIAVVFHENADGAERYHYSGTDTAHEVVLVDGAGATYRLVGASSFSGTSLDPEGTENLVTTDVQEFTITRVGGGLLGRVAVVNHVDRDGGVRAVDLGTCTGIGGGA